MAANRGAAPTWILQRVQDDGKCGLEVLAASPAAPCQMALSGLRRALLQGRAHAVVPAVEEAEERDDPEDLDDLALVPMVFQPGRHLVRDRVRDARGRDGEIEGGPLGLGEGGARPIVPDRLEPLPR